MESSCRKIKDVAQMSASPKLKPRKRSFLGRKMKIEGRKQDVSAPGTVSNIALAFENNMQADKTIKQPGKAMANNILACNVPDTTELYTSAHYCPERAALGPFGCPIAKPATGHMTGTCDVTNAQPIADQTAKTDQKLPEGGHIGGSLLTDYVEEH